jgi:hypothetical protein
LGNEFWAALIGAIIGGGFTLAAQFLALRHQAKELERKERDSVRSSLITATLKALRIYSEIHGLKEFIDECKNDPDYKGHKNPVFFVLNIINIPNTLFFNDREILAIQKLSDDEVLNEMINLTHVHKSIIDLVISYNNIRDELSLIGPKAFDGKSGMIALDQQEYLKWMTKIASGDSVIGLLSQNCENALAKYNKIIGKLSKQAREKFQTGMKTELDGDDHTPHWTKRLYGSQPNLLGLKD